MSQHFLFRPDYHFTPPKMWMNDPNGLVYYKGKYHLFYQYHPHDTIWGPMHWGHAVSRDLSNWQHLPIALQPDEHGTIFSGSVVIDWQNTAGFGKEAMFAIFTHHKDGVQSQSLAYSHDEGITWKKYFGNPILLSPDKPDFRDPKVFWYEDHWVMSLAAGDRILFYISTDIIHWEPSGSFGGGYGSTEGVWETPDLFELPVRNGAETRWVLTVSLGNGHPAGGSGTQYFIGHFDGRRFTSENTKNDIFWADFGADYYAPQSWNDEPNGRRLMIGWMNNWHYANVIPTSGWRGAFSLIRELSLTRMPEGIRLVHQPTAEIQSLRNKNHHWQNEILTPGTNLLADLQGDVFEIVSEFQVTDDVDQLGFHVRVGDGERTTIGYAGKERKLFVDRTHSGQGDFHDGFARIHDANLHCIDHLLRLHIFVDHCSVEVFANDGLVVMTDCIFPSPQSTKLELFVEGDQVRLNVLEIFELIPALYVIPENSADD
jgi:fructan beta-fructosidase